MLKTSHKPKAKEFDDSTNTMRRITKVLSSLGSNDDANGIVRGGARMFNSTTPQSTTTSVSTCAVLHARTNHAHKSCRSDVPIILLGWERHTHSTPVLPSGRKLWVAHRASTTEHHKSTTKEPTTTSHKR